MTADAPSPTTSSARALTDEVVASFDGAPDRLRELMQGLVRALHGFVVEHDVSIAEWRTAIDVLTRAGEITDEQRQEFILLSDTLGVSSLVDLLSHAHSPESTPSAVLGPFYVEGPPELEQGTDLGEGLPGEPVHAALVVTDTSGAAVAGAVVDVWQSDSFGFYDVQLPDLDGPVLRGRFHTDDRGRVEFRTILPSPYPIPDDGPVGQMLAATGRHPMRAPHLHVMIAAPGRPTLVTQLFVEGGEHLDSDTVFGVRPALVVPFPEQGDGTRRLDYVFVLADPA